MAEELLTLAYPSVTGASAEARIESLRRALITLTDRLNRVDLGAMGVLRELDLAIRTRDDAAAQPDPQARAQAKALRELIVRTADYAAEHSQRWAAELKGSYVAVSDFGRYTQQTQLRLDADAAGIAQLYTYTAGINNRFSVQSAQYVRTGLLYYDGAAPVYGVGVGNLHTAVAEGGEVLDRTQNELLTVTPGRLSFWQDGAEVAWLSGKKLHFPSGTLEAFDAVLSGRLTAAADSRLGAWTVANDGIYRTSSAWGAENGLYFGTQGLSLGSRFKVTADGRLSCSDAVISGALTATSLTLLGSATVTGRVNATDLQLNGVSIQTKLNTLMGYIDDAYNLSASVIRGGTLDFANVSVRNLYATRISTGGADSAAMSANGMEIYEAGARKVLVGWAGSNPAVVIGADNPAYVEKMYTGGAHRFWIGNSTMTCGILFNFTAGTYELRGTAA